MNDIIDKHSSCMDIAIYGALMNVKYDLIAKGHSSFLECHCRHENIIRPSQYSIRLLYSYSKFSIHKKAEEKVRGDKEEVVGV